MGLHAASPWTIIEPLRAWQGDALARWHERDHRGVIEAATGTGKTYVALAAIEGFVAEFGDRGRVVVVVSSLAMARQWKTDLIVKLGVPEGDIAEWHSEAASSAIAASPRLVLAVIDTARRRLPNLMRSWHDAALETLLVVDECHHAASPTNRRIFDVHARRSLGLSATVERDDGDEQIVYDGAGEICYTYSLLDALEDGVLAPITSVNLYVEFTAEERDDWLALGATVETLWAQLQRHRLDVGGVDTRLNLNEIKGLAAGGDLDAQRLLSTISRRSRLMKSASNRGRCVKAISAWVAQMPAEFTALVFHETIAEAQRSDVAFRDAGISVALEHSGLDAEVRRRAASSFRSGDCRVWVVVRAADEGIDVPDASCAVIVACTGSERQRVQRFGRILRHREGKQALALSVLVRGTPEEDRVGVRDEDILGAERVRHHRWALDVPIDSLLDASTPSSYLPGRQAERSIADRLVAQDVQLLDGAGREASSPFDPIPVTARKSLYPLAEAAALIGRNTAWTRNNIPRFQGTTAADDDLRVRQTEIEVLWSRIKRDARRLAPATPAPKETVKRPATRRNALSRERILASATKLGSNHLPTIAEDLGVDVQELKTAVTADPMGRYKLERLGKPGAA